MTFLERAIKRGVDVIASSIALIILSPLLFLIALTIRLTSPGPALFRQQRLGKDETSFFIYKFRTMIVDAPDIRNPDGSTFNAETDPRVTTIGRLLRKTSLDEVPQLINVLKGEMSLVGPRPDQVDQIRFYTLEERRKLMVKPGMTGLAQISGRNSITWEQRKQMDLDYITRQSFWLDMQILLKTFPHVIRPQGVYVENPLDLNSYTKEDIR